MDSDFILKAIKKKHGSVALVPEISIEDEFLFDTDNETDGYETAPAPKEHKYIRRIDALMFDSFLRTAIEVKVTKEDFRRDSYWKRRAWQKVTHRFVYAVPHYLDVMTPHGIGLWKVNEDGSIVVVKKAIINKTPDALPQSVIQRLAYRASI